MGTNDTSILDDTKLSLGVSPSVTVFDTDIKMHINSAFGTLTQLGVGPEGGYLVEDTTQEWIEFMLDDLKLNSVKTYVHLYVKRLFDPPQNSWLSTAMDRQIEELEWRLCMVHEATIPAVVTPLPPIDDPWVLDGGEV